MKTAPKKIPPDLKISKLQQDIQTKSDPATNGGYNPARELAIESGNLIGPKTTIGLLGFS